MTWTDIVRAKQAQRYDRMPEDWSIPSDKLPSPDRKDVIDFIDETSWLSPLEKQITGSSGTEIVSKASTGAWRASDIVRAFCHRATIAQQLLNP